jgi:D-alanyl-D-alanine carboxypeptidase/D-alanyl-D-alanine-endopeptidase (penicillin-binding protein 4)
VALLLTSAFLVLALLPLPAAAQEPAPAVPRPDVAERPAADSIPPGVVDRAELARRLRHLLSDPAFARAHVGLVVQVAETGETLFSRNGAKRFVPASTAKLVTGAAALEELGADFRWTTRLEAGGPVREGRLDGDLRIVGEGDPTLDGATLAAWADTLRAAGIDTVAGDVVGDDRAFPPPRWGRGWMWDDLHLGWAGGLTALRMADPGIRAWLHPGPRLGDDARVRLRDSTAALPLPVRVRTGAPGSGLRLRLLPGDGLLGGDPSLEGWIAADADSVALQLAPAHPTDQLLDRLRLAFEDAGIEVEGRFRRVRRDGDAEGTADEPRGGRRAGGREELTDGHGPADAAAWSATVRSDSLGLVLADVLKPSDNLGAESLLRTLGLVEGRTGTPEEGLAVVGGTLADWGVPPGAAALADGSGLSRYDAVTPTALVRLLRAMWRSPEHEVFRSALPSPAGRGTLEGRFPGTPVREEVRAKTGSLSSVRGLAGYVEDGDGETLVFALLMNGYHVRGDAASGLRDLLVEQLGLYHRAVEPGWPSVRTPVRAPVGAPADTAGGGR